MEFLNNFLGGKSKEQKEEETFDTLTQRCLQKINTDFAAFKDFESDVTTLDVSLRSYQQQRAEAVIFFRKKYIAIISSFNGGEISRADAKAQLEIAEQQYDATVAEIIAANQSAASK